MFEGLSCGWSSVFLSGEKPQSDVPEQRPSWSAAPQTWLLLLTCEEPESWLGLGAQDLDPAEEGEGDAVGGLGEPLDVPTAHGLRVPELGAGEGQDVEVRRSQLPVELLQGSVVALRLLAVTRHVYNQRRLHRSGQGGRKTLRTPSYETLKHWQPSNTTFFIIIISSTSNFINFDAFPLWTYFSSVLLQEERPPLRVLHLEGVKVDGLPRLEQLRLQEEQAAHADCHAEQHGQLLGFGVGGPGRVAP